MGRRDGAVAFFDVDGTLVWHDYEKLSRVKTEKIDAVTQIRPTEAVFEAFRRMRAAGHLTFICTGRPESFIVPSLYELNPDGFVAAAGAHVIVGDTVVRDVSIPEDLLRETVERFVAAGVDLTIEGRAQNVELRPSGAPARFEGSAVAHSVAEFFEVAGDNPFSKFCTNGLTLAELGPVLPFCEEHYTVADLQGGAFEFSLKGVNKGTGIEAALAYLGHGRERTFAFGDSENDLPMRDAVETFVAMGNALPRVKECADYVTDSASRDGVVTGLEHFGLI